MGNKGSGGHYRSVISGRYVTTAHGQRSPNTTVREAPGSKGSSGDHFRSAVTGRYVTNAYGQRNPRTTEKNS